MNQKNQFQLITSAGKKKTGVVVGKESRLYGWPLQGEKLYGSQEPTKVK